VTVEVERDEVLIETVRTIAREVAGPNAADVDYKARFPVEAIDALREARALSAPVPVEFGGAEASFDTIAECCFELGRHCGSSAMVFAMHQIQLLTIIRHIGADRWFEDYLREVVSEQRLIASVTSEVGTGGDMGRSIAAVHPEADGFSSFEKQAPTVSYGAHSDDLLTTLRRSPDAEPGDQVSVLTRTKDTELEPTGTWDVIGMRGTCSPGYVVRARFPTEQTMTSPFAKVASESMVPISHILWSHLWLGIATDAFDRARAFVRAAAKRKPGEVPPAGARLSHLLSKLTLLRAEVDSARRDFIEMSAEPGRERLSTMAAVLRFNNLKIAASEQVAEICRAALDVCGIMGFKNDTPFSIGRQLRDAMSASLMIANERIHHTNAGLLLIAKEV
jgi:acyl-CoA dehydrogenase